MTKQRPRISIPLTFFDKVVEIVTILVVIVAWWYAFVQYPKLPSVIPTHFDGQGNCDGYGPKWTLFLTTTIGTLLYGILSFIGRYPYGFKYPVPITAENAQRLYAIAARMLRTLKVVLVGVFAAINWQLVQVAMQPDFAGTQYVIGGIMIAIFGSVFYFLIQLFKNS